MKKIAAYILFVFIGLSPLSAQTIKVAILDFENISGIAKYDGLGKAMSSMLISDIEANVSPKRLQLVERSQIQKILKEQNFQASAAVDKTSSVKAGKLLGVKYLLVGDVFILNDALVINARLTDTETGDIKFSKKQEGKLSGWLSLKTIIAKELAATISMPFIEPNMPDKEMDLATIETFGNAIRAKDDGDIKKSETITETLLEINPDLSYIKNLKDELDEIKIELAKMNEKIDDALDNPEELALELINRNSEINKALSYLDIANTKKDFYSQFGITKSIFIHQQKARAYYRLGNFNACQAYYDSCLAIDNNFLLAHYVKMTGMMGGEFANVPQGVTVLNPNKDYTKEVLAHFDFITSYNKSNINSFNKSVYRASYLNDQGNCSNNPSSSECCFFEYAIELPRKNSATVFDDLFRDMDISKLFEHITYPTNEVCRYLIEKKEKNLAIRILENSIRQQFDFLDRLPQQSYYYKNDRNFNLFEESVPLVIRDNRQKYVNIFSKYSDFLIDENSLTNETLFDNILLLSQLYISNNKPKQAIELLDDFRLITQKILSKEDKNAFLLANFKIYLKQTILTELVKKKSEQAFNDCAKIYEDIKNKLPKYFINPGLDFTSFYSQQLEEERKLYSQDNLKCMEIFSNESPRCFNFLNQCYKNVEEVANYYSYNNQNKILIVHAFVDSMYEANDYPKNYYLTMDCSDGQGSSSITINANRHMFEDACNTLDSFTNKNKKVTIIVSLDEYGKISLLDIEMDWLSYNEMNFSSKSLYNSDELGTLSSNEMNRSIESCLSKLSNSNLTLYYQGLIFCFKEIGLNKSYQLLKNNSVLLNNLAWAIANSNLSNNQDYKIAAEMAERASYIVFNTDHNILDTYAFTLLKIDQKEKSKEVLKKAIELARSNNELEAVQKYENKLSTY